MGKFLSVLQQYLFEIIPPLAFGFLVSGIINEIIPKDWVEKNLGKKGLKSIFYATVTGTILPICCWGSLPIAISFYKKGSKLGPILALLVATPATSISALWVTYKLLGLKFAVFIFFAVILMGMIIGVIGNHLTFTPQEEALNCFHCRELTISQRKKGFKERLIRIIKFAYWDMPKEIGIETFMGIIMASIVATFVPIGLWIKNNLSGNLGYLFAIIFGLVMYICSTATVPLVDAFIKQGLNIGAGMTLLLIGPITSYGTIFVFKKEFGLKVLCIYLLFISLTSLLLGYIFSLI
ncbi:MAG: permease [Candidatus Omnitrophica bacterium]|nr:permease [Candidatus Omnitrophota bacterium]